MGNMMVSLMKQYELDNMNNQAESRVVLLEKLGNSTCILLGRPQGFLRFVIKNGLGYTDT